MALVVQELQQQSISSFISKYKLALWESENTSLCSIKYRQHESPLENATVKQCRGIILDSKDNWKIVARPFDKFFNFGEPSADTIDWDTAKIFNKEDGTLCFLYYYPNSMNSSRNGWNVGTPGCGDAAGKVRKGASHYNKEDDQQNSETSFTYAELFWKIFDESNYQLPNNREYTYMFELISPFNQLVVLQNQSKLLFLGARVNSTEGDELLPDDAISKLQLNFQCVSEFLFHSPESRNIIAKQKTAPDLISFFYKQFGEQSPLQHEGFVIVDKNFCRVKVKNPAHVAIQHLGDGHINAKNFLSIIQSAEEGEFLANFPQYKNEFEPIQKKYNSYIKSLEDEFSQIASLPKKQFTTAAFSTSDPECMIALRLGNCKTVKEYLLSLSPTYLLNLLHISAAKSKPRRRRKKNK